MLHLAPHTCLLLNEPLGYANDKLQDASFKRNQTLFNSVSFLFHQIKNKCWYHHQHLWAEGQLKQRVTILCLVQNYILNIWERYLEQNRIKGICSCNRG